LKAGENLNRWYRLRRARKCFSHRIATKTIVETANMGVENRDSGILSSHAAVVIGAEEATPSLAQSKLAFQIQRLLEWNLLETLCHV
jgi:hypothetical protein